MKTYTITVNGTEMSINASKIELAVRRGVEEWLASDKNGNKKDPEITLTVVCTETEAQYRRKQKKETLDNCKKYGHQMYGRNFCVNCKHTLPCTDCGGKSEIMFNVPNKDAVNMYDSLPMCKSCIRTRYERAGLPVPYPYS